MTCVAHARSVFAAMTTGKPYPVTAAISVASNPLFSLPNVRRTYEGLKNLEIYVVGEFISPLPRPLPIMFFPSAPPLRRRNLVDRSLLRCLPQGHRALNERRNTFDFWRGLGVRLGQTNQWAVENSDEVWNYRLSPLGLTFNQLLERNGIFGKPEFGRYKKFGFGTPSGKVELRSSTFEALGCEPCPSTGRCRTALRVIRSWLRPSP